MPHDATRVLLGTTPWSAKDISVFKSDPSDFPMHVAVRETDEGGLSTDKSSANALVGVSLGPDKKESNCTAVLRTGSQVPIRLTEGFSPTVGDRVWIDDVTGYANIPDDGGVSTTITNATYVTGILMGVIQTEDPLGPVENDEFPVALIDMVGGF